MKPSQLASASDSTIDALLQQNSAEQGVLMNLVSIKDLARDRYTPPRGCTTVREAVRDFKELCKNDPQVKGNLQDFELYHVGMFNPLDGSSHNVPPVRLSRGVDFSTP